MDEATLHLHIDFVPYFKGGARRETERNQRVAHEKEQLAVIMWEHGIEWEKKGTHEKHLSILDFENRNGQRKSQNWKRRKGIAGRFRWVLAGSRESAETGR